MRVLQSSISDIDAYEFFAGLDEANNPIWTQDIAQRKPVFEDYQRAFTSEHHVQPGA